MHNALPTHDEWEQAPGESYERIRERDGYAVIASGSPDAETLATDCRQGRQMDREGYIYLLETPEVQPDGARRWAGKIDLNLIVRQFPADTILEALAQQDFERWSKNRDAGIRQETPAAFVEHPDASVSVEQRLAFAEGRTVTIRGERVSTVGITCSW